jgi:ubiquinone/menaquinone biosynthesis C-methylase UbiE
MTHEKSVAEHYAHATLEQTILAALQASGKDLAHLVPSDLAPIDEFHIGGRPATVAFTEQLSLKPGQHVLDLGCGLGGTSRYLAETYGVHVTGIDLTADYIAAATMLAKLVGLESQVSYQTASATALPFAPARFDAVTLLHVGMNIADKAALFAEARRVLKPGGIFGIYDVMRESGEGPISFPVPWSSSPETSFLETSATYQHLLEAAGFTVEAQRSRRDFAIKFLQKIPTNQPPPLGTHLLMGETAPQKIANLLTNLQRNLIAPTEIISKAQ